MLIHVERTKQKMDEDRLAAMVATTPGNYYYLTGESSDGLRLFPHEHRAYAVISRNNVEKTLVVESQGFSNQTLDGFASIQDVVTYGRFFRPGPFLDVELSDWEKKLKLLGEQKSENTALDALAAGIKKLGLENERVGIDDIGLKLGDLEALQSMLPKVEFVNAGRAFRWIRKVKTDEEIKRLKAVTELVEKSIEAAMKIAREGVTEIEMVQEFDRTLVSHGGRPAFTLIHFGRNAVAGERLPSTNKLKAGEPIWFDCGSYYDGYWADLARIGCVGEPSARAKQIYHAMLEGENAAIKEVKAGMTGEDVFNLTMEASRKAGVPHYQRHHVGHGIGAELYEDVRIAPGVTEVIEEGTIVNIETPYYEFGLGALHVEDPFVVKAGGNQLLTTLSREMLIV